MMKRMITANKTARAITVIGYCLLVIVLSSCSGDGSQIRAQLEELERQNRADSVMTNDSLAEQLVKYFDHHGTPNERMRAHYILGRTYADMGEAPQALEEYHTAIECADTTANDCNYHLLTRIHAQSVSLFYEQLMPNEMLNELDYMNACAHHANDTLSWIITLEWKSVAYDLLRDKDNVKKYILDAYDEYILYGDSAMAADCLPLYIDLLIKDKDYRQAKQYSDYFEKNSSFFVDNKIAQGKEIYYYIKGNYYLGVNQLDSAEYYYRDAICSTMNIAATEAGYKGLYELFMLKGDADSVAKYANLCYQTSEKRFQDSNTRQLSHMQAIYNYNRYQKKALQNADKFYRATLSLIIISILSVIILLVASYLIYRNRRKQQRLQEAYESAVDKREDLLKELEALRAHDYDTLISQKEDKIKEQNQTIAELEGRSGKVSLRDFKESQIVKTFAEKSQFSKDHPVPNQAEWDMLEQQFRKDMPGLYRLFEDKGLSDLEFRTSLLLLLDYDEGTVAGLTQSSSQTINSAKARANQKLFNEKGAKSLHRALKKLI